MIKLTSVLTNLSFFIFILVQTAGISLANIYLHKILGKMSEHNLGPKTLKDMRRGISMANKPFYDPSRMSDNDLSEILMRIDRNVQNANKVIERAVTILNRLEGHVNKSKLVMSESYPNYSPSAPVAASAIDIFNLPRM